jgi:hypothetical protein
MESFASVLCGMRDCYRATVATSRFNARDVCNVLLAWLIGLNISDLITTRAVLLRGGAESNPVMGAIIDSTAHASFVKCSFLAIVVALALRTRFPARVAWTLGVVNLWYTLVVGWNLAVLTRA